MYESTNEKIGAFRLNRFEKTEAFRSDNRFCFYAGTLYQVPLPVGIFKLSHVSGSGRRFGNVRSPCKASCRRRRDRSTVFLAGILLPVLPRRSICTNRRFDSLGENNPGDDRFGSLPAGIPAGERNIQPEDRPGSRNPCRTLRPICFL